MAVALLSYFSTMVAVFATLMFCLVNVFGSASVHHVRAESPRLSAMARAMAAESTAAIAQKPAELAQADVSNSSAVARHQGSQDSLSDRPTRVASAKQTQKAKLQKLARDERRKERLAERRPDTRYATMALGYAAESPTRVAAERIFSTIRSRR